LIEREGIMDSPASQQSSYVTEVLSESESGSSFSRVDIDPAEIRLWRSTLRSVIKEIVGSNRGRLALLICWDLFAVIVAVKTAYAMSPSYHFEETDRLVQFGEICLLGLFITLSGLSFGMYEKPSGEGHVSLFVRTAVATFMAWALVLLLEYIVAREPAGRWIVAISTATVIWIAFPGRLVLRYVQKRLPLHVLVLGGEEIAESIRLYGGERSYPPFKVVTVGVESCDMSMDFLAYVNHPVNTNGKDHINWVVLQGTCERSLLDRLLPFFLTGSRICDVPMFFERVFQKVPVEFIDTNWLIQANVSLVMIGSRLIKRIVDVLGSLIGLLVTLPLWPAISLAIKLSDKGPVLYRQERVGRHGKVFNILKFRTMTVDAEFSGKAVWAKRTDYRVTPLGRFLRKTRLDELPQFINVILGHMSLVGPRPERPEFVEMLIGKVPHYKLRHLVRPGITGWAQINYRYAASLDDSVEKLRYDLYYVKYGGLMLDLQVMIRTIGVMMRGSR
jgi:exopolysaccharide biosynthesis polyprenyl glycosylphosphotransferase